MAEYMTSLPDVTYSQREQLVTIIHMRMMQLENFLKLTSISEAQAKHYNDELAETTALYNVFQNHF